MKSPFTVGHGRGSPVFDPRKGKSKPAGNKFGARKTTCFIGHTHDSKKEAARCNDLHFLERAGVISDLKVHPQFWFKINGEQLKHGNGRRVGYLADFSYKEDGRPIVEDVKGDYRDDAWKLRKVFFCALFPELELRIT